MLVCLENLCEAQSEAPKVTNVVIDGAAACSDAETRVVVRHLRNTLTKYLSHTFQDSFNMCHD